MREYVVIFERGIQNWGAYVPDLPGCISTGETRDEVEKNIREAIEFHIDGLKQDGQPIPEPSSEAGRIRVA
jgi:predicted RNase H-like HicB family nuclease